MLELKFKGGPVWLNSGGQGPDDYLLKPIKGGRWTCVIFRWGRNWTGSKEAADNDKAAMEKIMPVLQWECVPDNWERWQEMKRKGPVPTMNATEFLERYG